MEIWRLHNKIYSVYNFSC